MEPYQTCSDVSDIRELSLPQQLYLKPEAKLSITVALPSIRLPGKTISNWEVSERLKHIIQPDVFTLIKVSKSTVDFIRFDAEIENRGQLHQILARLDNKSMKLSEFPESLKVKAAEAKPDFPTRHDWDKFFRDAKNMNEMKPGERPDTIYVQGLPSKWFVSKKDRHNSIETPNEFTLEKVFEIFGEVRAVDIPMLDIYRNQMKASISGLRKFSHLTDAVFDAYIQYKEYICFVKAMDALRGMKLVHREGVKAYSASIKVDFDKTKHLSDTSIRRRRLEREKIITKEQELEEEKRREEETIRQAMEQDKLKKLEEKKMKGERRKEREEKRKQKILRKLKKKEAEQMNIKIAIEERKLLMAQRKLESIRLLDELFERVKQDKQREIAKQKELELDETFDKIKRKKEEKVKKKEDKTKKKKEKLADKEKELRERLVKKIRTQQEQQMEEQREKLKKAIEGKNKLKSVLRVNDGPSSIDREEQYPRTYPGEYDPYAAYSKPYDYSRGMYGYDYSSYRGYRGGYYSRRPYRGSYRGGYTPYYHDYYNTDPTYDRSLYYGQEYTAGVGEEEKKKVTGDANDVEDISSDSDSSLSSNSIPMSDTEDKKTEDVVDGVTESREAAVDPAWASYSDYYNPRFFRGRSSRRPRGVYVPRRAWGRGYPNPNVPMSSFYMQNINTHYYKYFNKLTKGEYDEHDERNPSRSQSIERVVCRKVLSKSRSKSRSRSYSRSRSRSRSHRKRSRSSSRRSRSRSKKRFRTRSRSSRKRSRSRSRSKSSKKRSSRSKSRSPRKRSKSRSKSRSAKKKSRSRSKSRSSRKRSKSRSKSRSVKKRSRSRSKARSPRKRSKSRSKSRSPMEQAESHSKSRSSKGRSRNGSKSRISERKSRSHSLSSKRSSKSRSKSRTRKRKSQSRARSQNSRTRSNSRSSKKSLHVNSKSPSKQKSLCKSKSRSRSSSNPDARRTRSKSQLKSPLSNKDTNLKNCSEDDDSKNIPKEKEKSTDYEEHRAEKMDKDDKEHRAEKMDTDDKEHKAEKMDTDDKQYNVCGKDTDSKEHKTHRNYTEYKEHRGDRRDTDYKEHRAEKRDTGYKEHRAERRDTDCKEHKADRRNTDYREHKADRRDTEKTNRKTERSRHVESAKKSSSDDRKNKSRSNRTAENYEESKKEQSKSLDSYRQHKVQENTKQKEESDLSLSLSGSDDWAKYSPERKVRPLGDPDWQSDRRRNEDSRYHSRTLSKVTGSFRSDYYDNRYGSRMAYRYEEPQVRSHVSRAHRASSVHSNHSKDSKRSKRSRDKIRKRKHHSRESESN